MKGIIKMENWKLVTIGNKDNNAVYSHIFFGKYNNEFIGSKPSMCIIDDTPSGIKVGDYNEFKQGYFKRNYQDENWTTTRLARPTSFGHNVDTNGITSCLIPMVESVVEQLGLLTRFAKISTNLDTLPIYWTIPKKLIRKDLLAIAHSSHTDDYIVAGFEEVQGMIKAPKQRRLFLFSLKETLDFTSYLASIQQQLDTLGSYDIKSIFLNKIIDQNTNREKFIVTINVTINPLVPYCIQAKIDIANNNIDISIGGMDIVVFSPLNDNKSCYMLSKDCTNSATPPQLEKLIEGKGIVEIIPIKDISWNQHFSDIQMGMDNFGRLIICQKVLGDNNLYTFRKNVGPRDRDIYVEQIPTVKILPSEVEDAISLSPNTIDCPTIYAPGTGVMQLYPDYCS
jgi:hypothetical protein